MSSSYFLKGCSSECTFTPLHTTTDADGSLVRSVNPAKPAGAYLIGSYIPWWNLYDGCWVEVGARALPRCLCLRTLPHICAG